MKKNIDKTKDIDKQKIKSIVSQIYSRVSQTFFFSKTIPDGFYSVPDIQDYTKHIIKTHETLSTNHLIHIYINSITNKLVINLKDEYKLELQTSETMKLFGGTKKLLNKTKNGENVPSLEVAEVVFVPCNLAYNQYKQKFEVLFTFPPNKSYAYLLNVEPSNLVFLKTYNAEFDEIIIAFTGRSLNR